MVRRLRSCSVRLARGLVDGSTQATGELNSVVVGPEVHEDQPRLFGQHVAMYRRDLDASCLQLIDDRVDLDPNQNEVAG